MREALRARRRTLHRLLLRPGSPRVEVQEVLRLAQSVGIPIEERSSEGSGHQAGDVVSLEAGPLPELDLDELSEARTLLALDGVEDPQNLGALCRVAEAAGVGGLVLLRRRAPPLSPAVSRASAGALEHLPVARVPNLVRALNTLKSRKFWVVAATERAACELFSAPDRWLEGPLVVLLGGEGRGLRRHVRDCADHEVRVPMAGQVESLNVSTAAAVVLFERLRRAGGAA